MSTRVMNTNEALGLEFKQARFTALEDLIPWFSQDYKIHELLNDFWGLNSKSRLIAVTKDLDDKLWKGLVSEWDSNTRSNGQFRINKAMIEGLLNFSSGKRFKDFNLKELTNLEMAIFENFFIELENYWKDFWRVSLPNINGTYTYLVWTVELEDREMGAIAIAIPPGLVPKNIKTKIDLNVRETLAHLDFEAPLDLNIGKTRLKISDIRGLEQGDLIVFEESDISHLIWKKNDFENLYIKIDLPGKDNLRFPDLYYDGIESSTMTEENHSSDDMLIDLPIELTAQFKSVQMPLKKIIELESGGILPLGLLIDSQLTLIAPGSKPIASGTLVIVGNQFGIRIDKTNIKQAPIAKLNGTPALQSTRANPPMTSQSINNFNTETDNLDQQLEDIGLDPKELDELEDLY